MTWAIIVAVCILAVIGILVIVSGVIMCLRGECDTPDWLRHENDMHGGG